MTMTKHLLLSKLRSFAIFVVNGYGYGSSHIDGCGYVEGYGLGYGEGYGYAYGFGYDSGDGYIHGCDKGNGKLQSYYKSMILENLND